MKRPLLVILLAIAGAAALAACGAETAETADGEAPAERGAFEPQFEPGERDVYEWRERSVSTQVNALASFRMEVEDMRRLAIETLAVEDGGATVRLTFERVRSQMSLDGEQQFAFDSAEASTGEPATEHERALRILAGVVVDAVVDASGNVVAVRGLEGAQRQVAGMRRPVRAAVQEGWFRAVIERIFRPLEDPPAPEAGATFEVVDEADMGRLPATGTVTTTGTVESVDDERIVVQTQASLDAEFDPNAGGGRILEQARADVIVWDRRRGRLASAERRSTIAALREMVGVQAEERREVEGSLRRIAPDAPLEGDGTLDSGNPPADGASDDADRDED